MTRLKRYRSDIAILFACCVGVFCMWQLSGELARAYLDTVRGEASLPWTFEGHIACIGGLFLMLVFGFYLPAKWDHQDWLDYTKSRPQKKERSPANTEMPGAPWCRYRVQPNSSPERPSDPNSAE